MSLRRPQKPHCRTKSTWICPLLPRRRQQEPRSSLGRAGTM